MSFVLGLDVGTASAAGATKRDGRVQPCALGDRTATLPAVVVLHDDGSALVGDEAERVAGLELTRVARDLRNNPALQVGPITVGGQVHTPQELLRTLYGTMVGRVTTAHGTAPTHVVLTHPALPEGVRCEAVDSLADEMFPGALVVPDPVAATVKLACDAVLPSDCVVALYDLGGGTFDTTIVQRSGDRFSVVGDPGGLADFGGIDIDDLVLHHVDRCLDGAIARLDLHDHAALAALTRLRAECRDAKERLSYDVEVTIDASLPNNPALVQLTRGQFEDMLRPRLETTVDVLRESIERAGLRSQDVDAVALLGGSSRIPLVVDLLTARTSMQVLVDPYPELTVALGAAQMVDDEAGAASVFPIADLALPSLAALGATGAAGATAADVASAGTGTTFATPPGVDAGLGFDDPPRFADGPDDPTLFGSATPPRGVDRGDSDDDVDMGPPSEGASVVENLGARSGALVLVGLVAILMVVGLLVALLGTGGGDSDSRTETDIASQLGDDNDGRPGRRPTSSSASGSSSSSSADDSTTSSDDPTSSSADPSSSSSSESTGSSGSTGPSGATGGSGGGTGGGSAPTTSGGGHTTTTRPTTTTTQATTTSSTTTSTSSTTTTTTIEEPPPSLQASWTAAEAD